MKMTYGPLQHTEWNAEKIDRIAVINMMAGTHCSQYISMQQKMINCAYFNKKGTLSNFHKQKFPRNPTRDHI